EQQARIFQRMGANGYAAAAYGAAAEVLRQRGHPREATSAARRAAALAAGCDVEPITGSTTLEEDHVLTADELRTARLAADGRSNRAIADELVVSVRTVENRLYRVYAKIGITGRDELPDAMHALGQP